jgi:antitoxin component YwqK of YwqJK toxin-antitoxin module
MNKYKRLLRYHRIPVIIAVLISIWLGYEAGSETEYHDTGVPVKESMDLGAGKERVSWYYDNGKKRLEGILLNKKREGVWKIWDKQGVLIQEGDYRKDKLNGKLRRWDDQGKLIAEENYVDDVLIK